MKYKSNDKNNNYYYEENSGIFFVNGNNQSSIINLPSSQNREMKSIIINTINVNTSIFINSKVKLDYNIIISKQNGITISNINFKVYKICDGFNYRIPINTNLFYRNSNLNESFDILNLTVYDDSICGTKNCMYILEATF